MDQQQQLEWFGRILVHKSKGKHYESKIEKKKQEDGKNLVFN